MMRTELYRRHLQALDGYLEETLKHAAAGGLEVESVLFHAGRIGVYHADDRHIAFWPTPHFRRWVPALEGAEHLLLARPGETPRVVRVRPQDYWYDTSPPPESYWEGCVDLQEAASFEAAVSSLGDFGRAAYIGNSPAAAEEAGIAAELVEPAALLAPLDWFRAFKTELEVTLIEAAGRAAAAGHRAAYEVFMAGASERDIHRAYLRGADHMEGELPFDAIVALDQKSAILHYQHKRGPEAAPGQVLLLDAGATCEGYASDITRTWARSEAPAEFRGIVSGVDSLTRDLVGMVRPGCPYPEIHLAAHRGVAQVLRQVGVLKAGGDEAAELEVTGAFFPHGVGHHLGVQVHDVGGRQAGPDGGEAAPPEAFPHLRTTRTLEAGHVLTIEPGIYFIPMLLDPLRETEAGRLVEWSLVEQLTPYGGVRIEDDVLCTEDGQRNLTRSHLQDIGQ